MFESVHPVDVPEQIRLSNAVATGTVKATLLNAIWIIGWRGPKAKHCYVFGGACVLVCGSAHLSIYVKNVPFVCAWEGVCYIGCTWLALYYYY